MTEEQQTLVMIKGAIFDLPAADQEKVKDAADTIREIAQRHGVYGSLALALVGSRGCGCGMKRVYIAGPMTGLPDFNYPAFNRAADALRAKGYHVENPADNPVPPCGTWKGYMLLAIAQLITCDTVALLPGWSDSKGAKVEHQLALDLDLDVLDPWLLERIIGA